MIRVLHIAKGWGGGATRATCAVAKYLGRTGGFRHSYVALNDFGFERGAHLAGDAGIRVLRAPDLATVHAEIERADVVQVEWWNNASIQRLLASDLPAMRLVVFVHVAGDVFPSLLTRELVAFADFCVAGCRYTYERTAIQSLSPEERVRKAAVVPATTDFARLGDVEPKPHAGFNVGYIGRIDFRKMHPDFVAMSARVRVPGVRFLVYGRGETATLARQAAELGVSERFELGGWVEDIRSVFEVLDVYGYPLAINTGSELNLHEALYAGVPPVVFARGGIRDVVLHEFTGLVVRDASEYAEAVEYLYHRPDERARLSANSRAYARQVLGGERSAEKLARVYEKIMAMPKRRRSWPGSEEMPAGPEGDRKAGARLWVSSLGEEGMPFLRSLGDRDQAAALAADERIARVSQFGLWSLREYEYYNPDDGYLPLWQGLILERQGDYQAAVDRFARSLENGVDLWRVRWYLARSAEKSGDLELAREHAEAGIELAPEFAPWHELLERLRSSSPSPLGGEGRGEGGQRRKHGRKCRCPRGSPSP